MTIDVGLKKEIEDKFYQAQKDNLRLYDDNADKVTEHYTLVCYFGQIELITKTIEHLRPLDTKQFFYDPKLLHVTALSEMKINANPNEIIKVVDNFLSHRKFTFDLLGIGGDEAAVSIMAYPQFDLAQLRSDLRKVAEGKFWGGNKEKYAWMNILRYKGKPSNDLISGLEALINTDFGTVDPIKTVLLKNTSKVLKDAEVVHEF